MTIPLPTWLICESCGLRGRAYQFPIDKTKPERRNRSTSCYQCWHATLPIKVGDRVTIRPSSAWNDGEVERYGGKSATVIGYSPAGGERGWDVELYGGASDGWRLWLTLDEMEVDE